MPPTPHATDAELAVLRALWAGGEATIRELTNTLYPEGGVSHYATVQKLLDRLEAKELVRRDRGKVRHTFAATLSQEEMMGERLRELAATFRQKSLTPLVAHLLENEQLNAEDRKRLRELLEKLVQKSP